MKANELRVGNLVEYGNRVFEIDVIAKEFPTLNTFEFVVGVVDWNNIKPIPLTKEFIDKLNENEFDFCGYGTVIIYQSINFPAIKYDFVDNEILVYFNDEFIKVVKYVHSWQNIHYALTGEELNYDRN